MKQRSNKSLKERKKKEWGKIRKGGERRREKREHMMIHLSLKEKKFNEKNVPYSLNRLVK